MEKPSLRAVRLPRWSAARARMRLPSFGQADVDAVWWGAEENSRARPHYTFHQPTRHISFAQPREQHMSIFVGVDGGGTKTKAVAIDQSKSVIGSSETGSTNQNSVGKDVAKANLHAAISAAVSAAGRALGDIACLCLSMSGVDCPADEDLCMLWFRIVIMRRSPIVL
jgi:hypothetical protein